MTRFLTILFLAAGCVSTIAQGQFKPSDREGGLPPGQLLKPPAKPAEIITKLGELDINDSGRAAFTFAYLRQLGAEFEEPEELAIIGRFLKSESGKVRAGAARVLMTDPPDGLVEDLKTAAADLNPDEQATLGVVLAEKHADGDLLNQLVGKVTDPEIELTERRQLAMELLPLSPKTLAPAYAEMLRSKEEPIRYVAWKRLTQLAGKEMGRTYEVWAGWVKDQLERSGDAPKLPAEEEANFEPGEAGIGIMIREAGHSLMVYGVGPGSPADQAGLQPGDLIDAVNNMPVTIRTLTEAVNFEFRGEIGTPVLVTYRKPGQPIKTIQIIRQDIKVAMAQGGAQIRFGQFVEAPDIPFPAEVNESSVQVFIDDVLQSGNSGMALDGQRMLMLRRVGPGYIHLLLDAMESEDMRAGISNVIETLADETHRDAIVARLDDFPELIDVIHDRGWALGARQQLLDGMTKELEEDDPYLPTDWIGAVVQLQDRESYPLLTEYFRRGRYPAVTYKAIRDLPGIDLSEAVAEAWHVASWRREIAGDTDNWFNTSFFSVRDAAQIAVEFGHIEALEVCISRMGRREWTSRGTWEEIVRQHIDFIGTATDTESWFLANRDKLKFNPATRRFSIHE
ncbi:MAG: hypothetical protein ACI8UO_003956 [Verrucomicrobiales bacterium]